MAANSTKKVLCAINIASSWVRGFDRSESLREEIRSFCFDHNIEEDDVYEVEAIVHALILFSDSVRVAERNNRPLVPMLGETINQK